ncbi:sugar phosphorylase [Planococcus maritimus]|uniref:sugar phosphorylase n=1 Tax=Planococcus maritimus TaxID=192421 RepID=UPI00232D1C51|nr:sugar phosphorylase [Planococcus maritimus]
MSMNQPIMDSMNEKLKFVYGANTADYIAGDIKELMSHYRDLIPPQEDKGDFVSEKDVLLISYGDTISQPGEVPLQSLREFLKTHLKDTITGVHVLPFYPFSSDDGFSVIDYFTVNPELGEWKDIEGLAEDFDVMFDAVINHISAGSEWFQSYLKGDAQYQGFFTEADPKADYSQVTRPRALPLLTKFETVEGPKFIWTTFSEDQIDLNYRNPKLFLKMIELLLFYISKGAKLIRLDAIGFMWKESGTNCIHLDETHKLIQVMRDIVDMLAPDTILITETNVPHKDNISYFGNGYNEARMVYQFPLPPLTLHTFLTGNTKHIHQWAHTMEETTPSTTFFNFLASHDGIGMRPAEGILATEEVNFLVEKAEEFGGNVSYKDNGDGTKSPYELNINYFDALSHPEDPAETKVKRFIAAQSLLLSMAGVPGIYLHSLLGSRNYTEGVEETGRFRSINREKLIREDLEAELADPTTIRHQVLSQMKQMIELRKNESAFHPNSFQEILFLKNEVFSMVRTNRVHEEEKLIVLINVTNQTQELEVPIEQDIQTARDLVTGDVLTTEHHKIQIRLEPYQVMWIKPGGVQK